MRLAYISGSSIPSRAANSIHVMKMSQSWARQQHEVLLLARNGDSETDPFEFYGVERIFEIVKLPRPNIKKIGGVLYAGRNVRFLRKQEKQPDLVYGRITQGVLAAALVGYPVIYESHGSPASRSQMHLERRLFRSPNLKRFVVISQALRQEYIRIFPWLLDQVEVLVAHDGADPIAKGIDPEPINLKGRDGALQVGYVGHLYPGKGAEIVLQTAEQMPEVDFHLVGGTEEDICFWKSRTALPNVVFHGFVPHGQIHSYQQRMDILLLPPQQKVSMYAGNGDIGRWMSPLKMFEYMAVGKPIIASDLPVLREVLRNGENCLLCKVDRIEEWVAAIRKLQFDPQFSLKLGQSALNEFMACYTWDARAKRVLDGIKI